MWAAIPTAAWADGAAGWAGAAWPTSAWSGAWGGAGGNGSDHASLVQRVKAVQKMDGGADGWTAYLERHVTSKRDPARHNAQFLQNFLTEFAQSRGGAFANFSNVAQSKKLNDMVTQIKNGQRSSDVFKEAWWSFVQEHGNDVRDPAKHEASFLERFLADAPEAPPPDNGPAMPQDDVHQELISQVKQGQRASPAFKEAWVNYVREYGQDNRDPGRHDSSFLQSFLASAPAVSQPAPLTENFVSDDEHKALVTQMKERQRASEAFKEAWSNYVAPHGNIRDPARHSTEFLQQFLAQFGHTDQADTGKGYSKGYGKGRWSGRASPY